MSTSVKERLIEYLNYVGINKSEFGRRIGVSSAFITSMRKSIQPDKVRAIQEQFPDLNTGWLLTGEGEMLNHDYSSEAGGYNAGSRVPLIPASAFAGSIKGFAAEMVSLDRCESISAPVAGAEMAIQITGDSMEPEYPDGAYAFIRKINDRAFIPWGHTVILDTENGAFIKKIYPDECDGEYVWAKSINPNYPPMHIPKSSIYNLFRVLAVSRIFTTM